MKPMVKITPVSTGNGLSLFAIQGEKTKIFQNTDKSKVVRARALAIKHFKENQFIITQ